MSYLASVPNRDVVIAANQQITREWWDTDRDNFDVYVSQLVISEALAGDKVAAQRRFESIADLPALTLTDATLELAQQLVNQKVVPGQYFEDALHIALAAYSGMDYLLTWNFKHIANARLRMGIENVCRMAGYEPPTICTPQELLGKE
ncbi:MAG: type II toxin-antitoxin system VapC family toxin [Caldilinea sp.]